MLGRPGDDAHDQLQRVSQTRPFMQVVQRVIYFSSNNLLSDEQTDKFLEWVTESGNIWSLKEIINRKESTCQAFACRLLPNAIRLGNAELVGAILSRDARPENGNAIPEDAIATAACSGNTRIVQLLLDYLTAANPSDSSSQVGQYLNSANTGRYGQFTDAFPLSSAIRYGDITMVRSLLNAGADVNNWADFPTSALHVAIEKKDLGMVEILLQAGADVNIPPEQGCSEFWVVRDDDVPESPLQAAARGGMHEIVQRLLQEGADIDGTWFTSIEMLEKHLEDDGELSSRLGTALEQASRFGHFKTVEILLNAGANIKGGCPGSTALQAACGSHHLDRLEMARLLLSRGADVNGAAGVWFGRTALQAAAEQGDTALVQLLLDKDAHINAPPCDHGGITALQAAARSGNQDLVQALIEEGGHVNAKPAASLGVTCLQAAASSGNKSIVAMLLEHGADTNAPASNEGETALSAAVSCGHVEVAKMLLEAGAFVNQVEGGLTPLCLAISRRSHELFELLMKYGADPDPPGVRGVDINAPISRQGTMLQLAVQGGYSDIVQELISRGADVNTPADPERARRTALQLAVELNHIHIVQKLISCGADINAPACPRWGRTALQFAVVKDDIHMARKLILCGADVNAPPASACGATALQFAAMNGNIEMAVLLLENQADINAARASVQGRTALEGAAEHGRLDMVHLLLENDQDQETIEERCQDAADFAEEEEHFEIVRILQEWRRS
ncbi:hypothetical protein Neosp_013956 [[Neocosmospora] mangrovei]